MGIVLHAVEESDLAETFDDLVCGGDEVCEHLIHDGNLYYYRMTYEERKDLRERAKVALATSTMREAAKTALWAVVERYKSEKHGEV